jgi:hypothetical protein
MLEHAEIPPENLPRIAEDFAEVQKQIAKHEATMKAMDLDPGEGFIAMKDEAAAKKRLAAETAAAERDVAAKKAAEPTTPEPAQPEPPQGEQAAPPKRKAPKFGERKISMSKKEPSEAVDLEDALAKRTAAGLTETDVGAIRRWHGAFDLLKEKGSPVTVDAILGELKPGYGEGAYNRFRYRLFDAILDMVLERGEAAPKLSSAERAKLLRDFINTMPDPASMGSLNSKYRAARFAEPGDVQTIEGIKKSLDDPSGILKGERSRDADGALAIKDQVANGGPPDGTYAVDDKAGRSFDPKQADAVSRLAESTDGVSMGGKKMDGYIYWCEDGTRAKALAGKLDKLGLSPKLRVAYMDVDTGVVTWSR